MIWIWLGFLGLIAALLALDLGVLNRRAHVISIKEALGWTAFWIALALIFNAGVYYLYEHHWFDIGRQIGSELSGRKAALQFFTGYIVEKSLSLDNIFVIAMIFAYFKIPLKYQHRLLFWGVLGAVVMRGAMIFAGITLINKFQWMIYVFGALLIFTSLRMLLVRDESIDPEKNILVRVLRRICPMTMEIKDHHFFTRIDGRLMATPLCTALMAVESADVLFAVDSVPAVIAVTRDPFLVFTSNVFAILGLRSLYFALAAMLDRFRHMKFSLVFLLAFIGVKMMLSHHYQIPTIVSLSVIVGILSVGIIVSVIAGRKE